MPAAWSITAGTTIRPRGRRSGYNAWSTRCSRATADPTSNRQHGRHLDLDPALRFHQRSRRHAGHGRKVAAHQLAIDHAQLGQIRRQDRGGEAPLPGPNPTRGAVTTTARIPVYTVRSGRCPSGTLRARPVASRLWARPTRNSGPLPLPSPAPATSGFSLAARRSARSERRSARLDSSTQTRSSYSRRIHSVAKSSMIWVDHQEYAALSLHLMRNL